MFEEFIMNKEQEAAQMADKVTQYEVDGELDLVLSRPGRGRAGTHISPHETTGQP